MAQLSTKYAILKLRHDKHRKNQIHTGNGLPSSRCTQHTQQARNPISAMMWCVSLWFDPVTSWFVSTKTNRLLKCCLNMYLKQNIIARTVSVVFEVNTCIFIRASVFCPQYFTTTDFYHIFWRNKITSSISDQFCAHHWISSQRNFTFSYKWSLKRTISRSIQKLTYLQNEFQSLRYTIQPVLDHVNVGVSFDVTYHRHP